MKNRIGIVGGGQLGRMLGMAAKQLGFIVTVVDPTPNSPAGQVVDKQIIADFQDEKAIRSLAKLSDFLTFEVELANAKILEEISNKGVSVNPSARTLSVIKDKLLQKRFLTKAGIPTAEFAEVESVRDIQKVAKKFGFPLFLKARFDAYDGRGNALIQQSSDIKKSLALFSEKKVYVEKFVPFSKELAIMVARGIHGEIKTYPVVETIHENNICHVVLAPAPVDISIRKKAEELAVEVMKKLKGAGVFGIEMFLTNDGNVVINEIAPRVHNSGHYTIEACVTSQFEQHIRAITGMPLGNTHMNFPAAAMINILGERNTIASVSGLEKALAIPNVSVHIYGKAETRKERKMGHITVADSTIYEAYRKAKLARKFITI